MSFKRQFEAEECSVGNFASHKVDRKCVCKTQASSAGGGLCMSTVKVSAGQSLHETLKLVGVRGRLCGIL